MEATKIVDALYKGVVTIVFKKLDTGEIRTMPGTLNKDIHKQNTNIQKYNSPDVVLCYALDKKAWRDVRISTIQDWYEGYPK